MGKKSAPAPDYTAAAEKTADSQNTQLAQQTWANRPTQKDPWGSVSWNATQSVDPATGKPVTQWTQETTLDPRLQNALDAQIATQQQRSNIANALLPQVQQAYSQQIDFDQFTPLAGTPQGQMTQATTNPYGFGPMQQRFDTSRAATPQLQTGMNFSGLQGVDQADATRRNAYNAIYQQGASRLDPQWAQQQNQLQTQLANQGITQGSDAYSKAMDQFQRQKTDAYDQLAMSATQGAGQQAQIDYGINMGLRQQQANEAQQQAAFHNQALGQQFGMGQQAGASQLAAQQAAWQQALGGAQYGLGEQQQAYQQNLGANAQNFQQQMAGAQYQNQTRQQQIAEANQQQSWALNALNALLSGQQVQNPQFSAFSQAGQGQGVDYSGAAQNQYGAAMDAANARNAMTGNLIKGGASLAMAFSDRRVKTDIRTVGRDPRGWRIVSFRYIGEITPRLGVIAQEVRRVRPDAVAANDGVLMVDYPLLYGS